MDNGLTAPRSRTHRMLKRKPPTFVDLDLRARHRVVEHCVRLRHALLNRKNIHAVEVPQLLQR